MTFKMSRVVATESEVEVSNTCPNPDCRADFTAPNSLREEGWIACSDLCRMVAAADGTAQLDDYDSPQEYTDGRYVTGLSCVACGEILASTEDQSVAPHSERAVSRSTGSPGD